MPTGRPSPLEYPIRDRYQVIRSTPNNFIVQGLRGAIIDAPGRSSSCHKHSRQPNEAANDDNPLYPSSSRPCRPAGISNSRYRRLHRYRKTRTVNWSFGNAEGRNSHGRTPSLQERSSILMCTFPPVPTSGSLGRRRWTSQIVCFPKPGGGQVDPHHERGIVRCEGPRRAQPLAKRFRPEAFCTSSG